MVPHRYNAKGDFYVIAGGCMSCGSPGLEAPELIAHDDFGHCYFVRQPADNEEVDSAIRAVWSSCCSALRYGGEDSEILKRFGQLGDVSQCDKPLPQQTPIVVRNRARFKLVTTGPAALSHLLESIAKWVSLSNGGSNSEIQYLNEEGWFDHYLGTSEHRYSIRMRLRSSGEYWLLSVGEHGAADVAFSILLDKSLREKGLVTDLWWFSADEVRRAFLGGGAHPY